MSVSSSKKPKKKELRALKLEALASLALRQQSTAQTAVCLDVSGIDMNDKDLIKQLLTLLVDRECNTARHVGVFTYSPDTENQLCLMPDVVRKRFAVLDAARQKLKLPAAAVAVCGLDVGNNPLNNNGVVSLALMLRVNTTVRALSMCEVDVTPEGVAEFARIMCGNAFLYDLQVGERPACTGDMAIVPGLSISNVRRTGSGRSGSKIGRKKYAPTLVAPRDSGGGTDTTSVVVESIRRASFSDLVDVSGDETKQLLTHVVNENSWLAAALQQLPQATSFTLTHRWPCAPYSINAQYVPRHVRRINLEHNRLAVLPDELFVRVGQHLVDFAANDNRLTSLNVALLVHCRVLRAINVASNRIQELPDEFAGLEGTLLSLNVANNRLATLPPSVFNLMSLKELIVRGNPLRSVPADLVANGNTEFINFMRMGRSGITQTQQRGKLLLVGEPNAGKTSLLNAIAANVPVPSSSSAPSPSRKAPSMVRISSFESTGTRRANKKIGRQRPTVKFVAWDYNGHSVTQRCARHMFVAASRGRDAIFLVTVRVATLLGYSQLQASARLTSLLRSLCGYDNSQPGVDNPIVVVFTCADELDGAAVDGGSGSTLLNSTLPAVLKQMQSMFPNVVGGYLVSAVDEMRGIDELREALYEMARAQCANHFSGVPAWYTDMADYLPQYIRSGNLQPVMLFEMMYEALTGGTPFGNMPRRIVRADLHTLLDYLNDIGVVLNYPSLERHPIVLNPEWFSAALVRIYDDADIRNCAGIQTAAAADAAIQRCLAVGLGNSGATTTSASAFLTTASPRSLSQVNLAANTRDDTLITKPSYDDGGGGGDRSLPSLQRSVTVGTALSAIRLQLPPPPSLSDQRLLLQVKSIMRSMSILVPLSEASSAAMLQFTGSRTPVSPTVYLFPEMLRDDRRLAVFYEATLFGMAPPAERRSVHRVFVFRERPHGLMEHVTARMAAAVDQYVLVGAWRNGLLVYWRDEASSVPTGSVMITMSENGNASSSSSMTVRVVANRPDAHIAQTLRLFHSLTTMFREWMQIECTAHSACTVADTRYLARLRAVLGRLNSIEQARAEDIAAVRTELHYIENAEITRARMSGATTVRCPCCSEVSSIDVMMPDTSVENVRHFIDRKDAHNLIVLDSFSDLDVTGTLGAGAFGVVYRAVCRGEIVAVKMLLPPSSATAAADGSGISTPDDDDTSLTPRSLQALDELLSELAAMIFVPPHPNLVALRGVVRRPLGIIIEYANMGTLFEYIHERKNNNGGGGSGSVVDDVEEDIQLTTSTARSALAPSTTMNRSRSNSRAGLPAQTRSDSKSGQLKALTVMSTSMPSLPSREGATESRPRQPSPSLQTNRRGAAVLSEQATLLGIALGVARGMAHLHGGLLVHRDLKSPNILLHCDRDGQIVAKVADFGLSVNMQMTDRLSAPRVENPMWLAPEVLQSKNDRGSGGGGVVRTGYSDKSDVYSFGVVLYELFYKRMPYESRFDSEIENAVRAGQHPPLDRSDTASVNALIRQCWARVPLERPTFAYICNALSAALAREARTSIMPRAASDDDDSNRLAPTM